MIRNHLFFSDKSSINVYFNKAKMILKDLLKRFRTTKERKNQLEPKQMGRQLEGGKKKEM